MDVVQVSLYLSLDSLQRELCSCLGLLQQDNDALAHRPLALVSHEQTHAPRSSLEQAGKLGPGLPEMETIRHTRQEETQCLFSENTELHFCCWHSRQSFRCIHTDRRGPSFDASARLHYEIANQILKDLKHQTGFDGQDNIALPRQGPL